jgi:hypothetical protein
MNQNRRPRLGIEVQQVFRRALPVFRCEGISDQWAIERENFLAVFVLPV